MRDGTNFLILTPFLPPSLPLQELGIKKCDLDKIWPQADFITLHTPLTPDTKNLINSESLAQMKKGVHIVNCARGGIVNEMDLLASLEAGHVGGAALDVYEKVRKEGRREGGKEGRREGGRKGEEGEKGSYNLDVLIIFLPPSLPPSLPFS